MNTENKTREEAKEKLKNLILVYEYEIELIEEIKDLITSMDGKIMNNKLCTAIKDKVLTKNGTCIGYAEYEFKSYSNETNAKFDIHCYRDSILSLLKKGYSDFSYDNKDSIGFYSINSTEAFSSTDTGKWRIDAQKINSLLSEKQSYLRKRIDTFTDQLHKVNKMLEEMQEILDKKRKFDKDYDFTVREIFGCIYTLRYDGSEHIRIVW